MNRGLARLLCTIVLALAVPSPLARIESGLKQQGFSGVVLVTRHGKPVLERAYGIADRSTGRRNRIDTKFNLASVGKSFTAVAVAQLVQAGKLSFSDKVGEYVPELPRRVGVSITIADLLDHTSGLGDYFASPLYPELRPKLTSLEAYLPMIVRDTPVGPPGAKFRYSNSGYILLGLVVERVSGLDYYAYLRRNVFARAGMKDSGCFFKDARVPNRAVGYTGGVPNSSTLPPRGTSAGGCYSTAPDLLLFTQALFDGRLVGSKLAATLTTPKIPAPGGSYGYGFGIRAGTIWHNGGSPGVGAEFDVDRRLGYTVVVLSNRDPETMRPSMDLILNTLRIP